MALSPYWYGTEPDTKTVSEIFLYVHFSNKSHKYGGIDYRYCIVQKILHFLQVCILGVFRKYRRATIDFCSTVNPLSNYYQYYIDVAAIPFR